MNRLTVRGETGFSATSGRSVGQLLRSKPVPCGPIDQRARLDVDTPMRADQIEISRPCPVDLDALGVDRSGLGFHCPHCDKDVHVLSNRTQDEAAALLATLRGKGACVSYLRAKNGEVQFREPAPLVPAERLRVRRAAGLALALALAACAPHGPPQTIDDVADEELPCLEARTPVIHPEPIADDPPQEPSNPEAVVNPTITPPTITAPPKVRKQVPATRKVRREDLDVVDGGIF